MRAGCPANADKMSAVVRPLMLSLCGVLAAPDAKCEHGEFHSSAAELHGFMRRGRPDVYMAPFYCPARICNQVFSAERTGIKANPTAQRQKGRIGGNQAATNWLATGRSAAQAVSGRRVSLRRCRYGINQSRSAFACRSRSDNAWSNYGSATV